MLKRDNITPPTRRSAKVSVPGLGGDVLVRQLSLTEGLAIAASDTGGAGSLVNLLATAVVDADGLPIYSAEQWDIWAVDHVDDFKALAQAASDLNGGAGEAEKKG